MALLTNGDITMYQIKEEFILATDLEFKLEDLRAVGTGGKEVKIGGVWRTLNPCSPVSPSTTAPFKLTDWYGYNHAAVCCYPPTNVRINPYNYHATNAPTSLVLTLPDPTADVGLGFYLSWEGSDLDVVIQWSISWFGGLDSGQGTTAILATFDDAMTYFSFVRAVVTNKCGSKASQTIAVSFTGGGGSCTVPSNVQTKRSGSTSNLQVTAGVDNTFTFDCTFSGTSDGVTYLWVIENSVSRGTNASTYDNNVLTSSSITAKFNIPSGSYGAARCSVTNNCSGTVTYTSNTIFIFSDALPTFCNIAQTYTAIQQGCTGGQVASQHTVSIPEGRYCNQISQDNVDIQAGEEARTQAEAQRATYGSCSSTCPVNLSSLSVSASPTTISSGGTTTVSVVVTVTGAGAIGINLSTGYSQQHNVGSGTTTFNIPVILTLSGGSVGAVVPINTYVYVVNNVSCGTPNLVVNDVLINISGCVSTLIPVGDPYCVGSRLLQPKQDSCTGVVADYDIGACGGLDFSKINVYMASNGTNTDLAIINTGGSGGTINLRYCHSNTFVCSWTGAYDKQQAEGTQNTYSTNGLIPVGETVSIRLWFVGSNYVTDYTERQIIVQQGT